MSKSLKLMLSLGMVAFIAACAQPEPEPVIVEPVVEEPVYNKF